MPSQLNINHTQYKLDGKMQVYSPGIPENLSLNSMIIQMLDLIW